MHKMERTARSRASTQNLLCLVSDDAAYGDPDREPLFEKHLTPSDVGKLNRLVLPKQQAEKCFLLGAGEKELHLCFEDEHGKAWRFRYSYWSSSQTYVFTKGWSRYVKEKKLDAGDVVLFYSHRTDGGRLFIGWRRRPTTAIQGIAENRGLGTGNSRTLRLFGVNLEYQPGDEHSEPSTSGDSSSLPNHGPSHHHCSSSHRSYHHPLPHSTDISFH